MMLWLKSQLRRLPLRNNRGGVMIEFGFAMPLLVLLMLGGVELGRYVLLHQKLDRTAMTVSDLVARVQTVTVADVNTIFTAANLIMEPFDISQDGIVYISSVKEDSGNPKVMWQRSGGGTLSATSLIGTQGSNATISDNDLVDTDQAVIIGETFFQYTPWFIDLIPTTTIRKVAVFRPRLTGEVTCGDC
ncbi:MAG: TadE/TadG family type IV pilus assembly protein [Pseudomonadota bacterium]